MTNVPMLLVPFFQFGWFVASAPFLVSLNDLFSFSCKLLHDAQGKLLIESSLSADDAAALSCVSAQIFPRPRYLC